MWADYRGLSQKNAGPLCLQEGQRHCFRRPMSPSPVAVLRNGSQAEGRPGLHRQQDRGQRSNRWGGLPKTTSTRHGVSGVVSWSSRQRRRRGRQTPDARSLLATASPRTLPPTARLCRRRRPAITVLHLSGRAQLAQLPCGVERGRFKPAAA